MSSPPENNGALRISPQVFVWKEGAARPTLPEGALGFAQISSEAFGDGTHPTTRLCAGAVDLCCRQKAPRAFLDVGTGTGILARIARARGAQFVAATDIDPMALAAARSDFALDHHSMEVDLSNRSPESWGTRFDLVVANILEGPLRELAPLLARALAPNGVLLLSGFTPLQIPGLRISFTTQGLRLVTESVQDSWALLMFQRD